ncbi:MAG: transposase [bacterium]|nr:transposase [bacterium]
MPEYDYSREGAYYITICAQDRRCLFGKIRNGEIALSECGRIVDDWWQRIPERYSGVVLDEYVIMPNHIHAIIVIIDDVICRGEVASPLGGSVDILGKPGEVASPLRGSGKYTLGQILAFYKYQTTKSINTIYNLPGNKIWQRNYWEHVIRNENSLHQIRGYIRNNPRHWAADDKNPERGQS